MGLAYGIIGYRKAAFAEVVRIIAADKSYGTDIGGSVIVVWPCNDTGSVACKETYTSASENDLVYLTISRSTVVLLT